MMLAPPLPRLSGVRSVPCNSPVHSPRVCELYFANFSTANNTLVIAKREVVRFNLCSYLSRLITKCTLPCIQKSHFASLLFVLHRFRALSPKFLHSFYTHRPFYSTHRKRITSIHTVGLISNLTFMSMQSDHRPSPCEGLSVECYGDCADESIR